MPFSSGKVPVNDDETDLSELEEEVDDQPYQYETGSDLLDDETVDPSTAEGLELLEAEIEAKRFELTTLRADKQAQVTLVTLHAEALATFGSHKEVLATERAYDMADEMSDLLATPLTETDVDSGDLAEFTSSVPDETSSSLDDEIAMLEAELSQMPEDAVSAGERYVLMFEDATDTLLDAQESLEDLELAEQELVATLNELSVKAGIYTKSKKGVLSYANKAKAKTAASLGLLAAGAVFQLVNLGQNIVAAVSLAKTVKHVLNLKKLKKDTNNPTTLAVIDYAIKQKTQKAGKKGIETLGGGAATFAYGVGKGAYKKLKGTKGKTRIEQAKRLHAMARGDETSDIAGSLKEASTVVRELVGNSNLTEALSSDDGWKIIAEKLRST